MSRNASRANVVRHVAIALALTLVSACGSSSAATPLWNADDLLVLDADAGDVDAYGEPRSVVFRCAATGDGTWGEPEPIVRDGRWRDAVSMAYGPGDALYVVESKGMHRGADSASRGAVFRVDRNGDVTLVWTHEQARQPVHLAYDAATSRVYITDRSADPRGLRRATGAVFVLDIDDDGTWPDGRIVTDERFVTPASVLPAGDTAFLLEADANPDGHPGTPGMLFAISATGDVSEVWRFTTTTSPIAFAGPWIVDANFVRDGVRIGSGALIGTGTAPWSDASVAWSEDVAVTHAHFPPRTFVDPTSGVALPDDRLAFADANADPRNFGYDQLGRGVYGSGRGCVLALDLHADPPRGEVLAASQLFVTPIAVVSARD